MQNEPFLNEQAFQLWTLVRFLWSKSENFYIVCLTIYIDLQTFTPDVKIVKLRLAIELYFPGILEGDRYVDGRRLIRRNPAG